MPVISNATNSSSSSSSRVRWLAAATLLACGCDTPQSELDALQPGLDAPLGALDPRDPGAAGDLADAPDPTAILPGFDVAIDADGDDVVLSWTEGGGSYEVWRSTDPYFAPGDPGSTLLGSTNETSFIDEDAACQTCDNHYYAVQDQAPGNAISTTVGAHVIAVYSGYNKIPMSLVNEAITSASDLEPLAALGFVSAYRFESSTQQWQWWTTGVGSEFGIALGESPVIELALGGSEHRVLTGYVPAPGEMSLSLLPGDNLVALPLTEPDVMASELLAAIPEASRIGRWDPAAQQTRWYPDDGPGGDFLIPSGGDLHVDLVSGIDWPLAPPPPPGPDLANDDHVQVRNDQTYGSAASALLANDAPGTTVVAYDTVSALGAAVNVDPDGTFTYEPVASSYGEDTFSYTADDGIESDTATVHLFVRPIVFQWTDIGSSLPGYSLPGNATVVGDVDGDGLEDLAWSQGVGTDMRTYVAFGSVHPAPLATEAQIEAGIGGFIIDEARLPRRVGDVNGDGLADILVGHGAPGQTSVVQPYNNNNYVVFGKADTAAVTPATLAGGGGFHIDLDYVENRNTVGGIHSLMRIRGIGDFDGDGLEDFVVSASAHDWPEEGAPGSLPNAGMIFVALGKPDLGEVPLPDAWQPGYTGPDLFMFRGDSPSAYCGESGSMRDADGDGRSDLLVYCDGARYLIRGRPHPGVSPIVVVTDGSDPGITELPSAGPSITQQVQGSIGDFNGDGLTDAWRRDGILFGAPGAAALLPANLAAGVGGIPLAGLPDSHLLRPTGDVDGDGYDDTYYYATYSIVPNRFLTFGRPSTALLDFGSGPANFDAMSLDIVNGTDWDGTGDMDGDGYDDVMLTYQFLMGDRYRDHGDLWGGDADDALVGTAGDDVAVGGRGNDVIELGSGSDSAKGGAGDDIIVVEGLGFRHVDGGTGEDVLEIIDAGGDIDLATIWAHRLQGIEILDLGEAGAVTLSLRALDIGRLSDTSNTLTILGDAQTTVSADLAGEGFVPDGADTWSNGVLTLVIQGPTPDVTL